MEWRAGHLPCPGAVRVEGRAVRVVWRVAHVVDVEQEVGPGEVGPGEVDPGEAGPGEAVPVEVASAEDSCRRNPR